MASETISSEKRLPLSCSNEVFFPRKSQYNQWKQELKDYVDERNTFQGQPEPYFKVTYKDVKERETSFNPITQIYKDRQKDKDVRKKEYD